MPSDRNAPDLNKLLNEGQRRVVWEAIKELNNDARKVTLIHDDRKGELVARTETEIRA